MSAIELLRNLPIETQQLIPAEIGQLARTAQSTANPDLLIIPGSYLKNRLVAVSVEDPTATNGKVDAFKIRLGMVMNADRTLRPQGQENRGKGDTWAPGFRSGLLSVSELLGSGQITQEDVDALNTDYIQHWQPFRTADGKYVGVREDGQGSKRMYLTAKGDDSFLAITLREVLNPTTKGVVVGLDGVGFYNLKFGPEGNSNVSKVLQLPTTHSAPAVPATAVMPLF